MLQSARLYGSTFSTYWETHAHKNIELYSWLVILEQEHHLSQAPSPRRKLFVCLSCRNEKLIKWDNWMLSRNRGRVGWCMFDIVYFSVALPRKCILMFFLSHFYCIGMFQTVTEYNKGMCFAKGETEETVLTSPPLSLCVSNDIFFLPATFQSESNYNSNLQITWISAFCRRGQTHCLWQVVLWHRNHCCIEVQITLTWQK